MFRVLSQCAHIFSLVQGPTVTSKGMPTEAFNFRFSIVPIKKIRYLITFVSIPEGLRADRWLDSQGKRGHVALPVPSEITRRCGVVLGFSGREEAKRTYRLLMDNKFAPEDVYVMEDRGGLSKLMIE